MTNEASTESLDSAARQTSEALAKQWGASLILQAHCLSIHAQPLLELQGFTSAPDGPGRVRRALDTLRMQAHSYLDNVQPALIASIARSGRYHALRDAALTMLAQDASRGPATHVVRALQEQASAAGHDLVGPAAQLDRLHASLQQEEAFFRALAGELLSGAGGSHSVLGEVSEHLSSINGKLAGAQAAVVLDGLAAPATRLSIIVGTVSSVSDSPPLTVGGAAVLSKGPQVAHGALAAMAALFRMRSQLAGARNDLPNEVRIANLMGHGLASAVSGTRDLIRAVQATRMGWQLVEQHLQALDQQLDQGKIDGAALRRNLLDSGNAAASLHAQVRRAVEQSTGGSPRIDATREVGDLLDEEAQRA